MGKVSASLYEISLPELIDSWQGRPPLITILPVGCKS